MSSTLLTSRSCFVFTLVLPLPWFSATTTGDVTVPFVLSLGVGFSSAAGASDGFGILMCVCAKVTVRATRAGTYIRTTRVDHDCVLSTTCSTSHFYDNPLSQLSFPLSQFLFNPLSAHPFHSQERVRPPNHHRTNCGRGQETELLLRSRPPPPPPRGKRCRQLLRQRLGRMLHRLQQRVCHCGDSSGVRRHPQW